MLVCRSYYLFSTSSTHSVSGPFINNSYAKQIVMSYIGTQRRHDLVGSTVDIFDFFRWENWTPKLWEFLPFNHGPRICLGRNFAWMQMEYVICRVFQEFSCVELWGENGERVLSGEEMKIKIALNTKPAGPVLLRFGKNQS